ncbi:MAG TPA: hypothetical protein VM429_07555 [Micropruina sp.]|jgi:hypothetical protein|nr:hypothetical protein [Micropruina sp.]
MTEPEGYPEPDEDRVHSEEPAEGAEQPGEAHSHLPHAEAAAEGDDN